MFVSTSECTNRFGYSVPNYWFVCAVSGNVGVPDHLFEMSEWLMTSARF